MPLGLAFAVSAAVALLAWWARALTVSGAVAGTVVGALILHGSSWQGGAVLAAFFVSSNLLSRAGAAAAPLDAKGDRRDSWQVLANGGAAAAGAALAWPNTSAGIWIVTASLAAAAADTWATTLGLRYGVRPRLPWSGRAVAPGTSGGMTPAGTGAGLAGAFLVAAAGAVSSRASTLLPVATLIGFLGMLADSTIGAFLQGRFHCPQCNEASEWAVHRCGTSTERKGGVTWLNNDGVNLIATTLAAGAGWVAWLWLDSNR